MKRNEILGEHKKGVKAVKHNKKPKDHSAEYGKAKEKLAPVKPMEGYNPNSVGAEHRRKLDQSHAADLKARAESPDATERDQQRYQNYLDRKEQMANDYNDRMERESIEQGVAEIRDRRDSYQRDYDSSIAGMDGSSHREFKRQEMEHELGHETNNYAVAIDGRTWKVFASKNHAQAVARSLQNKGKKATVHETGAEPTAEAMGADVGKITKVDPTTKKATLTKPDGSSMEVDSTALKPTPDGKMSMDTPDTDELKMGTAVVSTENIDQRSTIMKFEDLYKKIRALDEGGITLPNPDGSLPPGAFTAAGQEKLNKTVGDKMNAPSTEKDLGNGFTLTTTEFEGKSLPAVLDTQDKTYWIEKPAGTGTKYGFSSYIKIQNGKADGKMPGDQTVDAMKAAGWKAASTSSPRPSPEPSANEPFVPRDYQTKEPLTKGPDGNWRNSKGEARDGLHGGPVTAQGTAQFRSLTASPPTQESADNQLLQKMLSIAGLR